MPISLAIQHAPSLLLRMRNESDLGTKIVSASSFSETYRWTNTGRSYSDSTVYPELGAVTGSISWVTIALYPQFSHS